jgi:hypothetical protein
MLACLLTWRIPLDDVVESELRRSEASGRAYKKENEMLRGKGEETKVLGLTTEVNLGMKWLL